LKFPPQSLADLNKTRFVRVSGQTLLNLRESAFDVGGLKFARLGDGSIDRLLALLVENKNPQCLGEGMVGIQSKGLLGECVRLLPIVLHEHPCAFDQRVGEHRPR
jgi:hypothetical protein